MILKSVRVAAALVVTAIVLTACGSSSQSLGVSVQQSNRLDEGISKLSTIRPNTFVNGTLSSKNGPFLTDRFGRVVTLHGVNAVYKLAPYTLTVEPGQPNSLANDDAQRMAKLGFNFVRLGVIWAGIEPGSGGPNQPNICTPGPASDPKMWNQEVANAYLNQVKKVVDELGRHHIYVLIDMHQDVWSSVFGGEGAPAWAVCTSGIPLSTSPGRWSNSYGNPSEVAAWNNFWNNDVVGGLQQQYQRSWVAVAKEFATNSWVVGYDPINEPSAISNIIQTPTISYTASLSCFYGGSGGLVLELDGRTKMPCPVADPKMGLIEAIESVDRTHLVMPEIDNASGPVGETLFLGTTEDLPRVVYNFHDYCPQRSGVTGNPTDLPACSNHETTAMINNMNRRVLYATKAEPLGPAILMSEFGATSNFPLAALLSLDAQSNGLSWAWWSWRYYNDPTGSSAEPLVQEDNLLSPIAPAITASYAMAVAGTPIDSETNVLNGQYTLIWESNPSIKEPTTIYIDPLEFKFGYCTYVQGGANISSHPGAQMLTIENPAQPELIGVRVVPGKCLALPPGTG